jgi:hypothetical protein
MCLTLFRPLENYIWLPYAAGECVNKNEILQATLVISSN